MYMMNENVQDKTVTLAKLVIQWKYKICQIISGKLGWVESKLNDSDGQPEEVQARYHGELILDID